MKLFHFNPHNYGMQYFVAEENKTKAYEALIKHLSLKVTNNSYDNFYISYYEAERKLWENVNPLDPTTYPEDYTIDEQEVGQIIETEIE